MAVVSAVAAAYHLPMQDPSTPNACRSTEYKPIVLTVVPVIERSEGVGVGLSDPSGFALMIVMVDPMLVLAETAWHAGVTEEFTSAVIAYDKGGGVDVFDGAVHRPDAFAVGGVAVVQRPERLAVTPGKSFAGAVAMSVISGKMAEEESKCRDVGTPNRVAPKVDLFVPDPVLGGLIPGSEYATRLAFDCVFGTWHVACFHSDFHG